MSKKSPRKPTDSEVAILKAASEPLEQAQAQFQAMQHVYQVAFDAMRQACGASAEHRLNPQTNEWEEPPKKD